MMNFSRLTKERVYNALANGKKSFWDRESNLFRPNERWMEIISAPGQGTLGDKFVVYYLPLINDYLRQAGNLQDLTELVYSDPEIDVPLLNSFVSKEGYFKYKDLANEIKQAYEEPEAHVTERDDLLRLVQINSVARFYNPWQPFAHQDNIVNPLMWCDWEELKNWKRVVDDLNKKLRAVQLENIER